MNNKISVEVEQSVIDDLKLQHGIDALKEIQEAIRKSENAEADITITNNGDKE